MKKLLCATVFLLAAIPAQATYVVRISDLQYSPTPPNPIKIAGRVTSETPLTLTDGKGVVIVTGVTGRTGDFMVIEGSYDGSSLAVPQDAQKATVYAGPALTEMVYIPGGSFLMGNNGGEPYSGPDELPQHLVYLSGYWIGRYEVTRGEYRQFMDAGGYSNPAYWSNDGWAWRTNLSRTEPGSWAAAQDFMSGTFTQTDAHPVVWVSYHEAEAYCRWACGRLPTEAEWEKAARWDGHPRVYPWGDTWDAEKCNNFFDTNPAGGGYQRNQTAPVGSYPTAASPYGLQDMAGNVWEWAADWYGSGYYSVSPSTDPPGPSSGSYRVLRGGGWDGDGATDRCAYRSIGDPSYSNNRLGFRIAR